MDHKTLFLDRKGYSAAFRAVTREQRIKVQTHNPVTENTKSIKNVSKLSTAQK